MSFRDYVRLLGKGFVLIIVCISLNSCFFEENEPQPEIFIVKVPPFYDEKFSPYGNYLRFQDFLFPPEGIAKDEIAYPKAGDKQELPHDDSLLQVTINHGGDVTLNLEDAGNTADTNTLKARLTQLFRDRETAGVYETGTWKVVKAVGIKSAHSVKYAEFIKVVESVKQSGAEPIVLLFDDDARPKFRTNLSTDTEK